MQIWILEIFYLLEVWWVGGGAVGGVGEEAVGM